MLTNKRYSYNCEKRKTWKKYIILVANCIVANDRYSHSWEKQLFNLLNELLIGFLGYLMTSASFLPQGSGMGSKKTNNE